ncbi:hypothetical protein SEUCBS139899_000889 [Sporothrix eucalyptigena]
MSPLVVVISYASSSQEPEVAPQEQPQKIEQPGYNNLPPAVGGKKLMRRGGTQRRKVLKNIHAQRAQLMESESQTVANLETVKQEKEKILAREARLEETLTRVRESLAELNADTDRIKAKAQMDREARRKHKEALVAQKAQEAQNAKNAQALASISDLQLAPRRASPSAPQPVK